MSAPSAQHIQNTIYRRMIFQRNHKHAFANTYWNGFEADMVTISQADYAYEWEIKRSQSDLRADMKKRAKHYMLGTANEDIPKLPRRRTKSGQASVTHYAPRDAFEDTDLPDKHFYKYAFDIDLRPRHFTYVCAGFEPKLRDIPHYAGLVVLEGGKRGARPRWRELKKAPVLESQKITHEELHYQLRKMSYRFWNQRLRNEKRK